MPDSEEFCFCLLAPGLEGSVAVRPEEGVLCPSPPLLLCSLHLLLCSWLQSYLRDTLRQLGETAIIQLERARHSGLVASRWGGGGHTAVSGSVCDMFSWAIDT